MAEELLATANWWKWKLVLFTGVKLTMVPGNSITCKSIWAAQNLQAGFKTKKDLKLDR